MHFPLGHRINIETQSSCVDANGRLYHKLRIHMLARVLRSDHVKSTRRQNRQKLYVQACIIIITTITQTRARIL